MNNHVFLDAGIVLDMAISSRQGHKAAIELLDAIEEQSIRASVCATDLPAIFGEITRHMGKEDGLVYLQALVKAFGVATVDQAACQQALVSFEGSFGAAVLQTCAETANADFILTESPSAYRKSSIKAIDIARFLSYLAIV